MKIHHVEDWQYWYDRSHRCWFAAKFDDQNNQTTDAMNAFTEDEILWQIAHYDDPNNQDMLIKNVLLS